MCARVYMYRVIVYHDPTMTYRKRSIVRLIRRGFRIVGRHGAIEQGKVDGKTADIGGKKKKNKNRTERAKNVALYNNTAQSTVHVVHAELHRWTRVTKRARVRVE